jgi:hypothetical protein
MAFGGFYKGEKKKAKKGKGKGMSIDAPMISMPEIISKKKKDY